MLIPDYISRRYMYGHCLALSIAIKRKIGLPIYSLVEQVGPNSLYFHAYNVNETMNYAVDIRGCMDNDPSIIAQKSMHYGQIRSEKVSIHELSRLMGNFPTKSEIYDATKIVDKYFLEIIYDYEMARQTISV